jgi:predicted ribosome quality control (RQC) complex YloA/Tae2 family protein
MLSLLELQHAARSLEKTLPELPLRRIKQAEGENAVVLVFEGKAGKFQVLLSCSPLFARIGFADTTGLDRSTSSFQEYLRAHLIGSFLKGVEISPGDRQMRLQFRAHSGSFVLILSIMGARSNIYLLDSEGNLVHSLRPLDDTRQELKIGSPWVNPAGKLLSEGEDRWGDVPDELYLEAIEKHCSRLEREHAAELLARKIEQAIKKEKSFLERKFVNLQEDLGNAQKAEEHKRKGELLKGILHTIKPGDDAASATDYETGETVEIPLDPKISPAANLESYFARYQKESRGVAMIRQQLDSVDIARSELESILLRIQEMLRGEPDKSELESIAAQPRVRRLIHRYASGKKSVSAPAKPSFKKDIPSRLLPKRYRTQDGLEIWVGKSDAGNDYLTTRLARGNDLFFHLEGYPGSHVILRTEGRPDPPSGALLDACELAVHFSKLKHAGSADVHVAPVKEVKKPKGAKPGLVYVRKGKTIRLKRDAKRLENILTGRIED